MHPCKDCVAPKRKVGCHSNCPEYLAWLQQDLERKETIRKNKDRQNITHVKNYRKNYLRWRND